MSKSNKKVFTVKVDDKDVEFAIERPSQKIQTEAQTIYNSKWAELVSAKPPAIVRARMNKILREQGLWTDEEEAELEQLQKDLLDTTRRLAAGRNGYDSKDEAIEAAKEARKKRTRLLYLSLQRNSLDEYTAESQAETARINYLIFSCTVYNTNGAKVYKSLDSYYERLSDPITEGATTALITFLNDIDEAELEDIEKNIPENKFLIEHGVLNDKLQYIKDGKLFDPASGFFVNEQGKLINENGELVNRNGDLVNEDGSPKVEYVPFD